MDLAPAAGSVTGYVATEENGRWTVTFGRLNEAGNRFLVAYEAIQGKQPTEFSAKKVEPPREESGFRLFAVKAIAVASADFGQKNLPYNAAVLPAPDGGIFVYLLPAQTRDGVYPLGGDARYLVSKDGTTIIERRDMHRSIIEFKQPKNMEKMESSWHTAVLDDVPEDSDVFHVLVRRPSVREMVATTQFLYVVEPDGLVKYLMTMEAFKRIANQKKQT